MASEIAGIYQFIKNIKGPAGSSADFIAKADTNGDEVLLKHEFVEFLKLEGYHASDDIIEKFWKSIDVNDSERRIENTDLKNYRAVTAEEIDYVEIVVEVYEEIKAQIDGLKPPKNLKTSEVINEWLQQMRRGLNESYDNWLEKGIENDYDLAATVAELVEKITPELAAKDGLNYFIQQASVTLTYYWEDDWNGQLGRNVKKMMKQLGNKEAENIVAEVQKLVNGMLENARFKPFGEATEFKQTAFTELQKVFLDKKLDSDSRVKAVLNGASAEVQDAVFERFYTMYYHYADNYYTDMQNGEAGRREKLVQVFLDWFEQVGKEYMDGLGATSGVTPSTSPWQCTFSGIQDVYTIESGKYAYGKGSVAVTKDGASYSNIKITIPDRTYIDEFEHHKGKTTFDFDTDNIEGPKTISFNIVVTDNVSGEVIETKTITVNVKAPTKTEPTNQEIVNTTGELVLESYNNEFKRFWAGNGTNVAEDLWDSNVDTFAELYNGDYNLFLTDKNYGFGIDSDVYPMSYLLNTVNDKDFIIPEQMKVLCNIVENTLMASSTKFNRAILSAALENVSNTYINNRQTDSDDRIVYDRYDDAICKSLSNNINSKDDKSGLHVYKDTECDYYYIAINFRAFVDDTIAEYKRLGGTFS